MTLVAVNLGLTTVALALPAAALAPASHRPLSLHLYSALYLFSKKTNNFFQ